MQLARRNFFVIPSLLAALGTLACGEGSATLSPTGPTTSLSDAMVSADATAGASTFADVDTATTLAKGGKGRGGSDSEEEQKENGKPEKVWRGELSGFVTAADGTSLTVRGITVTPAADVVIRHGRTMLTFASIAVGNHVQARGAMADGTLVATEIKVERTGKGGDDDGEVEGVVSGLTSTTTCPVLTFVVGTTTVTTSAETDFDGVLCSALANGVIVEIEGTRQTDGSIVATKVEPEDDGEEDDEEDADEDDD